MWTQTSSGRILGPSGQPPWGLFTASRTESASATQHFQQQGRKANRQQSKWPRTAHVQSLRVSGCRHPPPSGADPVSAIHQASSEYGAGLPSSEQQALRTVEHRAAKQRAEGSDHRATESRVFSAIGAQTSDEKSTLGQKERSSIGGTLLK
eukprot:XP_020396683.1 uncharacterized protein LOC109940801 [Zea mays]